MSGYEYDFLNSDNIDDYFVRITDEYIKKLHEYSSKNYIDDLELRTKLSLNLIAFQSVCKQLNLDFRKELNTILLELNNEVQNESGN